VGCAVTWDDHFVTTAVDPGRGQPTEIIFDNGNRAVLVQGLYTDPGELLTALGLQPAARSAGVIFVCGGADSLTGAWLSRAEELLGPAVSAAAQVTGAVVLDGGTSSGVMAITGAARASRAGTMPVLAGVAPAGLVSYPGGPDGGDRVPLEENHSHFVLADSSEWGGETALLIALAAAYAASGRVALVLAGGGGVARTEILASVRRGWPVFVIQGTGGVAADIARLWKAHKIPHRRPLGWLWPAKFRYRKPPALSSIPDPDLREIVGEGDIRLVTGDEPGQLARQIAWELQHEPVLKAAWRQFATYDHLAGQLRTAFGRFQAWILLLGVVATLLGLIQAQVGSKVLHWVVVIIPILAAVLVAVAGRRAVGQRWVMLRAAAEAIKAEIYRYRALATGRARQAGHDGHAGRQQELAAHLDHIETRLMHTDASSGPLTPYTGPLPPKMYGAERDDDGLSPLDAERYLQIRIGDQLDYFHGRIRSLSRRRNAYQFLAIAAGAAGAILAAAGLEAWIGLTSGAAAALLAYLGYLQVDNTIVTYNQAAARLAGLERDWRALSPAQRTATAFKALVARGETVLTGELTGWVQQMSDTMNELSHKQAEAAKSVEPTTATKPPEPTSGN
jgi:TRPM family ion channel/conflict system pore-forming effector with SLATT domain/uncharacterized protein DUF4231